MLSNTVNGPRIVRVHRVAPYDVGMGMNDNEWTGRVFGSVGDVHDPPIGSEHISIVDVPNDAFHLAGANLLRVPQTMVHDAAFAEGPNFQNVGPFDEDDAGTDAPRFSVSSSVWSMSTTLKKAFILSVLDVAAPFSEIQLEPTPQSTTCCTKESSGPR
jgi:hypothetical protein